jgi:hypothetical protein
MFGLFRRAASRDDGYDFEGQIEGQSGASAGLHGPAAASASWCLPCSGCISPGRGTRE